MQKLVSILLLVSAGSVYAAQQPGEDNAFACMDSKTFEINSACISDKIEFNDAFAKTQQAIVEQAADTSDRAIATMTFDPKTLSIEIVAHKDALLAKAN